jgi:beta-lactamase regulating signal transducer with metallopeptidase domain
VSDLAGIALANALSATALALVVGATARLVRRPGLIHALWLLVLLDLLTPPVLVIGVLPSLDARTGPDGVADLRFGSTSQCRATVPSAPGCPGVDSAVAGPESAVREAAPRPPLASLAGELALGSPVERSAATAGVFELLGLAWLAGSAFVLLLALVRSARFERLLARGTRAPERILDRAAALARTLGLRRCPRVRLVPARLSPVLWFRPGRMEIVLPARLVRRLEPGELDALLGHELAHVRRGDHWVRWLELAASTLFFWHPVVWWARAGLRRAEEISCDAWVRRILPAHARDYAGGLIKTLEFLAPSRPAVPALASGLGYFRRLEERLTMIVEHRTPPFATRAQRTALAACGLTFLLAFPGAAQRSSPGADRPAEADERSSAEKATLEAELRALERRQAELANRLHELYRSDEQAELRREIARLEAEGRQDAARSLAADAARMAERAELEREHERLARARVEEAAELEHRLVEARAAVERAAAEGRSADMERARRVAERTQEEIEARAMDLDRRAIELERRAQALELEAQAEEARRLALGGRRNEADRVERELTRRKEELELLEAQRHGELERYSLEREARRLERQAVDLEREGAEREARELRRRAEELREAAQGLERRDWARALRAELARIHGDLERLVEVDAGTGARDADIDALRRAIDGLERALEEMDEETPPAGEVY